MSGPVRAKAVYCITEREGTRSFWTRIGSAWTNRDGSITVRLDALPVSGVLQIRDADEPAAKPVAPQTATPEVSL